MKKIYSLALALCLLASATAMPLEKIGAIKPVQTNERTFVKRNAPTLTAEQKAQFAGLYEYKLDKPFAAPTANAVRRAVAATPDTITIKEGEAGYLGNYYQNYGYIWSLYFQGNNSEYVNLQLMGIADNRLEAIYHNAYAEISVEPGDTVVARGVLKIDYVKAGADGTSPVYAFNGTFEDEEGKEYVLTGNYAFEEDAVYDVLYYLMCYYYKMGCDDMTITLVDAPVTPKGTENITITNQANKMYFGSEGAWYISAKDDKFAAGFQVYTDSLGGTFSTEEINYAYTELVAFVQNKTSIDTIPVELYKPLSVRIDDAGDTIFFTMSMMDTEGTTYNISMFYEKPNYSDADSIKIQLEGDIYYYLSDGLIQGQAINSAKDTAVFFTVYADSLGGLFTKEDLYPSNNYNAIVVNKKQYVIDSCTMLIMPMSMFSAQYKSYYMVTMAIYAYNIADVKDCCVFAVSLVLFNPYEYDAEKDLDVSYTIKRSELMTYNSQYQCAYIMAVDTTKYQFYTIAISSESDPTYILPLGTYYIDFSEEDGTVLGSAGLTDEGKFTYSYYYDIATGEVWFLTDGTMKMEATKMVFKAYNMKGYSVTITFNFDTTDLDDIIAANANKTAKILNNGRIYIVRDNKVFNVMGGRLK